MKLQVAIPAVSRDVNFVGESNDELPILVTWKLFVALCVPTFCVPKFSWDGVNFTSVPVPTSSTTCGLDEALSCSVTVPVVMPAVSAVNVAVIVQFPPGAILPLQLLYAWKGFPL